MVRQEIYGYLLTHYAISALICKAATEAGIDPDRVKFRRTVRIVRRRAADPAALSPLTTGNASSPASWPTSPAKKHLNPKRRNRTYPRVVKRARHNSYRVKTARRSRHPPPRPCNDQPGQPSQRQNRSMINLG